MSRCCDDVAIAGGNAAANAMNEACRRRDVKCCVVGVPKSIDNDILLIDRCFGFETAVAEAKNALLAAKVEARSAYRYVLMLLFECIAFGFRPCWHQSTVVDIRFS